MFVFGKAFKSRLVVVLFAAGTCLYGCAHGPVRHYTFGYYRYATIEFPKRSHWMLKPFALTFGLITDAVLIAADTAATPAAPVWLPPIEIEYSDDPEINGAANVYMPNYPFALAKIGLMGMGFDSKEAYEQIFGFESTFFKNQPGTRGTPGQQ